MTSGMLPGRPPDPVHVTDEIRIQCFSDGRMGISCPPDLIRTLGILEQAKEVARRAIAEHGKGSALQVVPAGVAQHLR